MNDLNTIDTALANIHGDAFDHGRAGMSLAASLARIAEDGVVLSEADFEAAIAGHAAGVRRSRRSRA